MTTDRPTDRHPAAPTRIGPTTFAWGQRTYVMGILNVTPDSFSGDGLLAADADPVGARGGDGPAGWSPRAPTCSISAANRPGPATSRSTRAGDRPGRAGHRGRGGRPARRRRSASIRPSRPSPRPPSPRAPTCSTTCGAPVRAAARWPLWRPPHGVPLIVMHNRAEARYDAMSWTRSSPTCARRSTGRSRPASPRRISSSIRASASERPPTTTSSSCAGSTSSRPGPPSAARHLAQVDAGPDPRPAGRRAAGGDAGHDRPRHRRGGRHGPRARRPGERASGPRQRCHRARALACRRGTVGPGQQPAEGVAR